jgi:hypothetical protein
VAKLRPHPAHFAVLSLREHHLHDGRIALVAHHPYPPRSSLAIRQPDTFDQLVIDIALGPARDDRAIDLLDAVPRMSEPVGQSAVVGQNHQTCAVFVQAADGVHALRDGARDQVDHTWPTRRVIRRRDVPLRFRDGQIDQPLALHGCPIDLDLRRRLDLRAELSDRLAIDGDAALEDQLLARPS